MRRSVPPLAGGIGGGGAHRRGGFHSSPWFVASCPSFGRSACCDSPTTSGRRAEVDMTLKDRGGLTKMAPSPRAGGEPQVNVTKRNMGLYKNEKKKEEEKYQLCEIEDFRRKSSLRAV